MNKGRRFTILIACFIGLVGNLVTYKLDFNFLICGRFIFGFSTGIFSATLNRYLGETVPLYLEDTI